MANTKISQIEREATIEDLHDDNLLITSLNENGSFDSAKIKISVLKNWIYKTESVELTDDNVILFPDTFIYDGLEKNPKVLVNDSELLRNQYNIFYSDNINAGTCTVYITGLNGYSGYVEKQFVIQPYEITQSNTLFDPNTFTYDGSEKIPSLTLNDKTLLQEGIDYTISYSDNINTGVCECTISGIGNYTGNFIKNFTISSAEKCAANRTRSNGTVTCSVITPTSGFTVYYSTDKISWIRNNTWTHSSTDGTENVYFKVEADGYQTLGDDFKFGYSVTRSNSTYYLKTTEGSRNFSNITEWNNFISGLKSYGYSYNNKTGKWYNGATDTNLHRYTVTWGDNTAKTSVSWSGTMIDS